MKYTGQLIAFFGPDGTGKSTTASIVDDMCRDLGVLTYRCHWRPRLLPSLHKPQSITHVNTRPDELSSRSWLASLFIYAYFYLDFTLAYLIKFRPMIKKGVVIIYERYYYDILFHPKRYKLVPIVTMGKFLTKLCPKPDLIVLMRGDPSIIHARKPELPIEEITRQQNIMKKYMADFGNIVSIDVTNTEPNECAKRVLGELKL